MNVRFGHLELITVRKILVVLVVTLCGSWGGLVITVSGSWGRFVTTLSRSRGGLTLNRCRSRGGCGRRRRWDGTGSVFRGRGLVGVGSYGGSGNSGGRSVAVSGGGGNLNFFGNAKDLANVDVVARLVNLRVVGVQNGLVQSVRSSNSLAGVVSLNDVSRAAVLLFVAQTDRVAWNEVGASIINNTTVDSRELVGRDVLCGTDAVANIALLDLVFTSASTRVDGECEEGGNDEQSGGEHDN
jgi:hypothetical protein